MLSKLAVSDDIDPSMYTAVSCAEFHKHESVFITRARGSPASINLRPDSGHHLSRWKSPP